MSKELNIVAFDCGNSSVRTMLCHFDGEKVVNELILQETNKPIEENGLFYWDMEMLFNSMKKGLKMASEKVSHIDSCGVCTWGIDFALIDDKGDFIQKVLCYRNTMGEKELEKLPSVEQKEMFNRTGILCDKINSIFMLRSLQSMMPDVMKKTRKILMVPDIFVYMFTGVLENEPSELSTSHFLNVKDMTINEEQCKYAGIDKSVFSKIGKHGEKVGNIKKEILEEIGIGYDIPFVCVPSHDTACAALAIPSLEEKYLFISSGTWSLVGAHINKVLVNDDVYNARLTNEQGAFGRTTLLRNSAGMFIVQSLRYEYMKEANIEKIAWDDFHMIADKSSNVVEFDVNNTAFFNPKSMADAIWNYIHPGIKREMKDWPELLRSTYISMGKSFATAINDVIKATKDSFDKVYVVGGGTKNNLIMQTFADALKMPIITCDMECSSVGNAVSQIPYFNSDIRYEDLRKIIVNSLQVKKFIPKN